MSTDAQKPDTTRAADAIHRAVVVFEVEGGNDKTIHGNRVDTQPILDALRAQGWHAEVVVYRSGPINYSTTCPAPSMPISRE